MKGKKLIVGFLVLLITSSIIYIALQGEGVKLRVDKDKTTLYVFEDSRWKIGGREYNKLFDGTRRLYRDVSSVKIYTHINETTNTTTIIRETPYKRGPFIRDTYYFKGDVKDKKLFPIYHKVEVYNASGLFYRYEVRDLVYSGPTYKLNGSTHLRFGRNVDVTLNPGYRWAWVYKSGIVKAQYDVESDYEVFYVKLFDPDSWWNFSWPYRQAINISNTAGDLTNYPVLITLSSTNVGSHFNWSNNGDDLRFIDSSDSELDYYIKSWNSAGHTAKIWVEIPSMSDDTNTTIYMYYGNSEADPQSNGSATFDFFDDFEDGNLDGWSFSGDDGWEISTTHYEGSYGAQNKDIDDSETACMYRTVSVSIQGEISFWWKVSSEEDSDYLRFYLDNTPKTSYSGPYWWEDWSFALSSGSHKIEWCYEKDSSGSEFADTGYVDYIIVRKVADPEPSVSSFGEEESCATTTTLYLDAVSADRYYEHGTLVVLKANVTDFSGNLISDALVCLDIDQVGYGDNYVCDNGTVEYNLSANAVLGEFNDSAIVKNFTYTNAPENKTFYIRFNKYDEIQSAYINLTGYENPNYPKNIKIYVNNTLVKQLVGVTRSNTTYINEFNDSVISKNLTYTNAGKKVFYLSIPKNAKIINASINLTGYESGELQYTGEYFEVKHYCIVMDATAGGEADGITIANNYFYIVDGGICSDGIYRYHYPSGRYSDDEELFVSNYAYDITSDGNYIWIVDYANDKVNKYSLTGTFIEDWSTYNTGPTGITTNGTHIWVANYSYDGSIYKYYINGTYTGEYFDTNVTGASAVRTSALTSNDEYIWVIHRAHSEYLNRPYSELVKFYLNGTYTGIYYNMTMVDYAEAYGIENDGIYFWITDRINDVIYKYWMNHYPTNLQLDIGNDDTVEWSYNNSLTNTTTVYLNVTALQNYVDSECNSLVCTVPIAISSNTTGTLQISNINISYIYNPININTTAIQDYLDAQSSSGYYNIPTKISSETNSTIQVDNINITYYGSDNITVTAHFGGNANYSASNDTHVVKVVYSRFNYSIPVNYGYLEFIPSSPTGKNVPSYGQTETAPSLNISWLNYDQPADLYMKINETHPCINITASTTYNKSAGYILNTSYIKLDSNKNLTNNTYLYLWADYACNYTDPYWRWWLPEFLLKACAINAVKCD